MDVLDFQNVTSNGTRLDEWPGDCVTNTATIDVVCCVCGGWGVGSVGRL